MTDGPSSGRLDAEVNQAMKLAATVAHKGSRLTLRVAIVAVIVVGLAYLTGLAALGGGARTVWMLVGGVLLLTAVGAPLLASVRLASIPRNAGALARELRTLLGADEEARRVVVETFAVEVADDDEGETDADEEPAAPNVSPRVPTVILQGQHYTRLHTIASRSGDLGAITTAFRRLATLPSLVFIGLALTALGGFLGFILLLIWIF